MTELLALDLVRKRVVTRQVVLDIGCGAGGKSLYYASRGAKEVIGVDILEKYRAESAALAKELGHAERFRFVCADATEWMAAAAGEGLHPDVVFLDPPRAGSTPECIAAVNKMKPRRVVYVSCDPETLARDVAAFTRLGWRAAKFCPVDLFPQTKHVETVCLLVK